MILQMTFIRQANLFVLFLGTMHGDAHTLRGGEMPMDGLPQMHKSILRGTNSIWMSSVCLKQPGIDYW